MPTILTHAALPLIGRVAIGPGRISNRLMVAGMAAAVLPDADVISFALGVPYGAPLGHRGISHSLAIALLLGALAALFSSALRSNKSVAFCYVTLSCASHGLTDALTNGGRGVALWWPFSNARSFAPFRPVEVSDIGIRGVESGAIVSVLVSELLWLVLPLLLFAVLYRRLLSPHIDLDRSAP